MKDYSEYNAVLQLGRIAIGPRSIMHGRKRPYFIVFRPFGIDRITTVICRVVNDQIRHFPAVFNRTRHDAYTAVIRSLPNGRNTDRLRQ